MQSQNFLNRIHETLLVGAFDLRDYLSLAQGKDRLVYQERSGSLPLPPSYARAAVIAIYPSSYNATFIINLMRGFSDNGFFVVAIATKKIDAQIAEKLLNYCHCLVERFPIGRDFGSYRMGIEWLRKKDFYKEIEYLALANDSMFYPQHISETIKQLLEEGKHEDWLGLFESYVHSPHVQSYFQIFRSTIFNSKCFNKFWRSFRLMNSRRHNVEQGEMELSSTLRAAKFYPYILYNMFKVHNDLLGRLKEKSAEEDMTFRYVLFLALSRIARSWRDALPSYRFQDTLSMDITDIVHKIGVLMEHDDTTRAMGMLCNHLYGGPVKRCRLPMPIVDTVSLCRGFSAEELEDMAKDLCQEEVATLPWKIQYTLRRNRRM